METRSVSEVETGEDFIGRKVRKNFEGHGYFVGEVISYNRNWQFFRVNYEDGDREDVDLSELEEILWDSDERGVPSAGEQSGERRIGKKGTGRKTTVESDRGQNLGCSEEKVEAQVGIGQSVPTKNLESSDLNRIPDQHCEAPVLPRSSTFELRDSKIVIRKERLRRGQAARKSFKNMEGETVRKYFQGYGHVLGKVIAYHTRRRLFIVEYRDGDIEELDWSELKEILVEDSDTDDVSTSTGLSGNEREGRQAEEGAGGAMEDVELAVVRADETGALLEEEFRKNIGEEEELEKSLCQSMTNTSRCVKGHELSVVDRARGKLKAKENHEAKKTQLESLGSSKSPPAGVHEMNSTEKVKVSPGVYSKETSAETAEEIMCDRFYLRAKRESGVHIVRSVKNLSWIEDCEDNVQVKVRGERGNQKTKRSSAVRFDDQGGVPELELQNQENIYLTSDDSESRRKQSPRQAVLADAVPIHPTVSKSRKPVSSASSMKLLSSVSTPSLSNEFIGRAVRKHFEGFGEFVGKVVSYNPWTKYFKVEYTDGDREDFDLTELSEIIVAEDLAGWTV